MKLHEDELKIQRYDLAHRPDWLPLPRESVVLESGELSDHRRYAIWAVARSWNHQRNMLVFFSREGEETPPGCILSEQVLLRLLRVVQECLPETAVNRLRCPTSQRSRLWMGFLRGGRVAKNLGRSILNLLGSTALRVIHRPLYGFPYRTCVRCRGKVSTS